MAQLAAQKLRVWQQPGKFFTVASLSNPIRQNNVEIINSLDKNHEFVRFLEQKLTAIGLLRQHKNHDENKQLASAAQVIIALRFSLEIIAEIDSPLVIDLLKKFSSIFSDELLRKLDETATPATDRTSPAHLPIPPPTTTTTTTDDAENEPLPTHPMAVPNNSPPLTPSDVDQPPTQPFSESAITSSPIKQCGDEAVNLKTLFDEILGSELVVALEENTNAEFLYDQIMNLIWYAGFSPDHDKHSMYLLEEDSQPEASNLLKVLSTKSYIWFLSSQCLMFIASLLPSSNTILSKLEDFEKQQHHFFSNQLLSLSEAFKIKQHLLPSQPIPEMPVLKFEIPMVFWGKKSYNDWIEFVETQCQLPNCLLLKTIENFSSTIVIEYFVFPSLVFRYFSSLQDKTKLHAFFDESGIAFSFSSGFKSFATNESKWLESNKDKWMNSFRELPLVFKLNFQSSSNIDDDETQETISITVHGYDPNIFIDSPMEHHFCCVCKYVTKDPYQINCCGAIICKSCKENSNANYECPECKDKNHVCLNDRRCEKEIMKLTVKCNKGSDCKWKGTLGDLKSHECISELKNDDILQEIVPIPGIDVAVNEATMQVTLKWQKPQKPSCNVTQYEVQHCKHDNIDEWFTHEQKFKIEYAEISCNNQNLKIDEKYYFRIITYFSDGSSIKTSSQPIHLMSLISDPPNALKSLQKTDESIKLKWDQPKYGHKNVESYKVMHRMVDSNQEANWVSKEIDTKITITTIDKLIAMQLYQFKVVANYSEAVAKESKAIDVMTAPTFPSPPGKPYIKEFKRGKVVITWNPPENAYKQVEQYAVHYYPLISQVSPSVIRNQCHKNEIEFPLDDFHYEVYNEYVFEVQAIHNDQSSAFSKNEVKFITDKIKPSNFGQPKVEITTPTSVKVSWVEPEKNPGIVVKEVVSYCTADDIDTWQECAEIGFEDKSVEINDLKPGKYYFRIKAYYQKSRNIEGKTSKLLELSVQSPPSKPSISEVSHNTAKLEWKIAAESQAFLQKYEIGYKCYESKNWDNIKLANDQSECVVDALQSSQKYSFKVIALFSNGVKLESATTEVTTLAMFTSSPSSLHSTDISETTVTIHWSPPERTDASKNNTENIMYEVAYTLTENENIDWTSVLSSHSDLSKTISGLKPEKCYSFKVRAKCGNDVTDYSDIIQVHMQPIIIGKPCDFEIYHDAHNNIVFKWKKPEKNSEYILSYRIQHSNDEKEIRTCSANTFCVELSEKDANLEPKTKYQLQVVGVNSNDGIKALPSDPIILETKPPMPEKPSDFSLVKNGAENITLEWKKPKTNSDYVDFYKINCYQVGASEDENTCVKKDHEVKTTQQQCTIDGLLPNTMYRFSLQAVSSNRDTEAIYIDSICTTSIVPCPINLRPVTVKATQVELQWEMPEHHTNLHYTVEYCEDHQEFDDVLNEQNTSQLNCIIKDLSQNTNYKFRVCSHSEGSTSTKAEPIQVTTHKTVSSNPGTPRLSRSGSRQPRSIPLEWDTPAENSEYVERYEVLCLSGGKNSELKGQYTAKLNENYIEFSSLMPNKSYCFKVRAHCQNGNVSEFSNKSVLIQTTKPLPIVHGIKAHSAKNAITDSSITISWICHGEEGGKVSTSFKVWHTTSTAYGDSDWKCSLEKCKLSSGKFSTTIHNLKSGTDYLFKIQAKSVEYNEYGSISDISIPIKTKHVPPGKPQKIKYTNNSVSLAWTKPHREAENVKGYAILYCLEKKDPNKDDNWRTYQKEIDQNETMPVDIQLDFGVWYKFKIVAFFVDGDHSMSEISDLIYQKYPIPSPPGKPRSLEITQTTVTLEWDKPDLFSDYVKHYKVLMKQSKKGTRARQGELENQEFQHLCTPDFTTLSRSITIQRLLPDTGYYFQIVAVNPDNEVSSIRSDELRTKKPTPSKPGKPYTLRVTHNSVKIGWEKPKTNPELVEYYIVRHRNTKDHEWVSHSTQTSIKSSEQTTSTDGFEITGLSHSSKYYFTVTPHINQDDYGETSEESEPVTTKSALPSAPGKPKGEANSNSIDLEWEKPKTNYENVSHYEIAYFESEDRSKVMWKKTTIRKETIVIDELIPNKEYLFYVTAVTKDNEKGERSLVSDLISNDQSMALNFIAHNSSTKMSGKDNDIPVYLLPKGKNSIKDEKLQLSKYDIKLEITGQQKSSQTTGSLVTKEKVIMLVGPTGSGKSTIINGMINYIMRVNFNDHFRLKLIHEQCIDDTASVTQSVSAYTIHRGPGFRLPYTLTIVDTPGFGDTRGMLRDKEITRLIKNFFSMKNGIDHLDGIGFVCQSGSVRLTPTQRYIFEEVFSMFGKDIKDNIFIFCTFCDGETPQVIKALEESKIPCTNFFKFNNSVLYSSAKNPVSEPFWDIGADSFRKFFQKFEYVSPVSLKLTKEVLQQRETLEIIAERLHQQILHGVNLIDSLRKESIILEENKAIIEANKNFKYTVKEAVMVEEPLPPGKYTTNCIKCNMTCHIPCIYANDEEKKNCYAMKCNNGKDEASCGACPGKCHWAQHRNASFVLKTELRPVEKQYADIHENYQTAMKTKLTVEAVIEKKKCDIDKEFESVFQKVKEANECTKMLDEIAFRPNHLNNTEYIQLLIDAEYKGKKTGYSERIEQYQVLQERAKLIGKTDVLMAQASKGGKHWWETVTISSWFS